MARLLTLCVCLLAVAAHGEEPVTLHVDTATTHQTVVGFGASLYPNEDATRVYEDERFRRAWVEAGFNIVRIQMVKETLRDASGDLSRPVVLAGEWEADREKFDMHAGFLTRHAAFAAWVKANSERPVRVVGAVWSPPHWMKGPTGERRPWVGNPAHDSPERATPWLSNEHNHWMRGRRSMSGDSIGGRLRTEDAQNLRQYGLWIAGFARGFAETHGVTLDVIGLQNESTFENPFDSMTLAVDASGKRDYGQFALALGAVREGLRAYGVSAHVKGPGVAGVGPTPANPFTLSAQVGMIEALRRHADLHGFLNYYGSNYYVPATADGARATAGYRRGTAAVEAEWGKDWGVPFRSTAANDRPVWFAETGDAVGLWERELLLAVKVMNALVFADASAYVWWQAADGNEDVSESNLLGRRHLDDPLSSGKWRLAATFSRSIRPGSKRVGATLDGKLCVFGDDDFDAANGLSAAAFVHGDVLTVVLLNATDRSRLVNMGERVWGDAFVTDATRRLEAYDGLTPNARSPVVAFEVPPASLVVVTGGL